MNNILIYDSTFSRCDAHCRALVGLGYSVWHYFNGNIDPYPPSSAPTPAAYDFIFHHANDALDATIHQGPILRYGGSAIVESGRVPRAVSPPDANLTPKELQSVLEFVKFNPKKTIDDAISFVWQDNEPMLALRLLCEAYVMPLVGAGDKFYQTTENGANTITIHCPDPGTWFELLEAQKPEGSIEQINTAIAAFGRLMGDAGDRAMDLARSIIQDGGDITEPACAFVKVVSEITAARGGSTK